MLMCTHWSQSLLCLLTKGSFVKPLRKFLNTFHVRLTKRATASMLFSMTVLTGVWGFFVFDFSRYLCHHGRDEENFALVDHKYLWVILHLSI